MVEGPHGFLWYVGRTPGYSQLVQAYANVLRLRTATVVRIGRILRVES
ncbi:MAG: Ferredoxin subunit of nitrite reductase or a ring-hydroxylating dioxygenase [Frankiales bacterium]|nr:Ferredoxin subunit of nitrite reductase or a ring-hydroxylating dioxygenase [Frankiales bacterium]